MIHFLFKPYFTVIAILGFVGCIINPAAAQRTNIPFPVPLSPRAAALAKYDINPVELSSGLTDINVPLFDVSAGPIRLPFSLAYHPAGIKVTEKETEVGLGWSIVGAGTINRIISAVPDEKTPNGNFNATPLTLAQLNTKKNSTTQLSENFNELRNIANSTSGTDMQPDIFSYNAGGRSGKFFFGKELRFITIPFKPFVITKGAMDVNGRFSFTIKDDQGIVYTYAAYGTTSSPAITSTYLSSPTTTWYLTRLSTTDGSQVVNIEYVKHTVTQAIPYQEQTIGRNFVWSGTNASTASMPGSVDNKPESVTFEEQLIKRISYNGHAIHFDYNADTTLLERIRVIDEAGVLANLITLKYNTDDTGRDRVKLISLKKISPVATEHTQTYQFTYSTVQLPSLTANGKYSQDQWGYYNGKSNTGLIASRTLSGGSIGLTGMTSADQSATWNIGNADRTISAAQMQAGVLQKITFPYGGYRIFEYEPHLWPSAVSGSNQLGGGLRIKSIKDYDSDGTAAAEKQFKYGATENGVGTRLFDEAMFFKDYQELSTFTRLTASGTSCSGNIDAWHRKYFGIGNYTALHQLFAPVAYNVVTIYDGIGADNKSRSRMEFSISNPIAVNDNNIVNNSNYGRYNQLATDIMPKSTVLYKYTSSGNYEPLEKKVVEFEDFYARKDTISTVYESRFFTIPPGSFCTNYSITTSNLQQFNLGSYELESRVNRMTLVRNTRYSNNATDSLVSVVNYEYGLVSPIYAKKEITTNSDGSTTEIRYDYPFDNLNLLQGGSLTDEEKIAYQGLREAERGRPSTPIQVSTYQNSVLINVKRTTFKYWNYGLLQPYQLRSAKGTNQLYTDLTYNNYDQFGSPTEYTVANHMVATLWTSSGVNKIAEVINANLKDIAYTSFESNDKGNWVWDEYVTPQTLIGAPSGNKVFDLNLGTVQKNGLSTSKTYILTYWANSSSANAISGGPASVIRTLNGWTKYRRSFTNLQTVTLQGTVKVDELRLYPSDAFMTSFIYSPKGDMTGRTDESERTTYFEYDGLGRLRRTRNQKRELLESICYNQFGQQINCEADTGTLATLPPDLPVVPPPPPPPPPPPIESWFVYAATMNDVCNTPGMPEITLFLNPSNNKYYYNPTFNTIAANGYYRSLNGTGYRYIVNGLLQSTGQCPPP